MYAHTYIYIYIFWRGELEVVASLSREGPTWPLVFCVSVGVNPGPCELPDAFHLPALGASEHRNRKRWTWPLRGPWRNPVSLCPSLQLSTCNLAPLPMGSPGKTCD